MRCHACQRNIAAGAEAQKMVVEYEQPDGSIRIHGFGMPDGPIANATGRMVRGWHSKHWWVAKKREAKGDAVTGRVVAGSPTGYEIGDLILTRDDMRALGLTEAEARERSTVQLSRSLGQLRRFAAELGLSVGDPTVQEAYAAHRHGGPYPHQHHHRLDVYQLIAHLRYAHGAEPDSNVTDQHIRLHAAQRNAEILAGRTDGEEPGVRDWRTQYTAEIP